MLTRFHTASLCLLAMLMLPAAATAEDNVCHNRKWTGSYVQGIVALDVPYLWRWNFDRDGTLYSDFTGSPQDALSLGQVTPVLGSWECRADGKIVATYTYAEYGGGEQLVRHVRVTALVTILDNNTLQRVAFVWRRYAPGEDVTDPNGGTQVVYPTTTGWTLTRLMSAEEDLQALP